MRIVELIMSEGLAEGVDAISIVEAPAIEENFIYLSKSAKGLQTFAKVDEERRIIVGPALVPNLPIYRQAEDTEFYVYFSSDTVRKVAHKFLAEGRQGQATLEHETRISGVKVVESWVVEDDGKDKSMAYGLTPYKGAWMVMMKVDNEEIWSDYVKTGKVKGFSIEGFFSEKRVVARAQLKKVIS